MDDTTKRIRELNDLARTAMELASRVFQTKGIGALPSETRSLIREKDNPYADIEQLFKENFNF